MNNLEKFLERIAYKIRVASLQATTAAGSGHPTSALSAADMLAVLFFHAMHFNPHDPKNPNNDRFILSKGHAAPGLYAVYQELGLLKHEELLALRTFNSVLEGHPTPRCPWIDVATGSLGQGLSYGIGMALSARLDKRDFRTYVLMGDAEVSEGSVWEAAHTAAYYKLNNLTTLLDVNRLGQANETIEGYNLESYAEKFKAFGWKPLIIDGHAIQEIVTALDAAREVKEQPCIIIAKTKKGYGIENVEDKNGYHGKAFSKDELPEILKKMEKRFSAAQYPDEAWKPKVPAGEKSNSDEKVGSMPMPTYKLGEQIAPRVAYGQALAALGTVAPSVISLDAEVKNSTFAQTFEKAHPQKFFECFVAEQTMVGMATGFATRHKIPYASTFAAFLTRAFDQIRMAAISRVKMCLVGSHAGVSIGHDGPSQMGLEDIAMMRTIPGSVVLYPSDAVSTWKLVGQMAHYNGISYLLITRGAMPVIYDNKEEFPIGSCKVVRQTPEGDELCIVTAGITLLDALKAHDFLKVNHIHVSVIDLYSIKPMQVPILMSMAQKSKNKILTVEDHYSEGGLGQAVAYELRNTQIQVECLAVTKLPRSGTAQELFAYEDIDMAAIVKKVKEMINKK